MLELSFELEASLSKLAFIIVGSGACYGISHCVSNLISADTQDNDKDATDTHENNKVATDTQENNKVATDTQDNDKYATNQHSHKLENEMKIKSGHSEKTVDKNQAASHLVSQNNNCRNTSEMSTDHFPKVDDVGNLNETAEILEVDNENEDLSLKRISQNNSNVLEGYLK